MSRRSCIVIGLISFLLLGCSPDKKKGVMITSVSSDGHYAITTDLSRRAILWNLQKHTYKVLDNKANIYSAYFIKNTDDFMWQHDSNNAVIIENLAGKVVKKFNPGFPVYGQVMTSDLRNYFASDVKWNVYKISGAKKEIIKKAHMEPEFLGAGKLLNLTLSSSDKFLLTSGLGGDGKPLSAGRSTAGSKPWSYSLLGGVVLWRVKEGQPNKKYAGLTFSSVATISPDERYVVGGDEEPFMYYWNLKTGKRHSTYGLTSGLAHCIPGKPLGCTFNITGLIKRPKAFGQRIDMFPEKLKQTINGILSLKFIDKTHYLRIIENTPWAVLFKIGDPKPIKYFYLGNNPSPSLVGYVYDQSVDTSWRSHILVVGQYNHPGIIVYKYSPKSQTLEKVWVGNVSKKSWW